ncbi:MAG: ATP-binding protein [Armatimonadetes bacterium]|nr:ATP-binding protein [Armatimonadota bacterium]
MPFVDRQQELKYLHSQAESDRAELVILYGRRRVGKTELLRHFCASLPHLFFVASQTTSERLLRDFSTHLADLSESPLPSGTVLQDWPSAFRVFGRLARDRRFVVVLDEFPYLLRAEPAVASQLQNLWDAELRRTKLMLVLCGSHVSVMESEVLGQRSPLYGRRTGQWRVAPLGYRDAALFFPKYSREDQLTAYGILGGMPAYLEQFDPSKPLAANVVERVLSRGSMLYEEVYFLLQAELRETSRYYAALSALASGATRHQDVARAIFGPEGRASAQPYLNRLSGLGIVERAVPATVRNPQRTRDALYRISDPFLRFWFRSAAPSRSALEQGRAQEVWSQRIRPGLPETMVPVFEECARAHTWLLSRAGRLPFEPDAVGSWWDGKAEIDVAAVRHSTKEAYLAECTWSAGAVHPREVDELQRKAAYFQTRTGYAPRGLALYARRQFSRPALRKAQEMGVGLYTVADLY